MVSHRGTMFTLRADMRPTALHTGWIEEVRTGGVVEVELKELQLDSIVMR